MIRRSIMKITIVRIPSEPITKSVVLNHNDKCPFCGESTGYTFTLGVGTRGISKTEKIWYTGFFKIKKHSVISCRCCTCGALWEENKKTEIFVFNKGD
jgi:hypothetical protein